MATVLDLERLPVSDSIEFLHERMRIAPVPLDLEPHAGVELNVRSRTADLGPVHLLSTRSQGGDIVRSRRLAADGTRPSLLLSVVDSGVTTVVRGEEAVRLRAGDIGLYLTDRPYRIACTPGATRHTYQIALDDLDLPLATVERHLDGPIRPTGATAAALSALLLATGRSAPSTPEAELAALADPVRGLIRTLLTRVDERSNAARSVAAESLGARIELHIAAHLGQPDLNVRSIAEAFAISERYVYVILARRGIDLGDRIRRDRLDRAVRLLEDADRPLTIAEIAARCGFADHAHLSRSFRARFGISPSAWRRGDRG